MAPSRALFARAFAPAALSLAVLVLLAAPSHATVILDQSSDPNPLTGTIDGTGHSSGWVILHEDLAAFQSIVIAHTGELTEIDLLRVMGPFSSDLADDTCCTLYLGGGIPYAVDPTDLTGIGFSGSTPAKADKRLWTRQLVTRMAIRYRLLAGTGSSSRIPFRSRRVAS